MRVFIFSGGGFFIVQVSIELQVKLLVIVIVQFFGGRFVIVMELLLLLFQLKLQGGLLLVIVRKIVLVLLLGQSILVIVLLMVKLFLQYLMQIVFICDIIYLLLVSICSRIFFSLGLLQVILCGFCLVVVVGLVFFLKVYFQFERLLMKLDLFIKVMLFFR